MTDSPQATETSPPNSQGWRIAALLVVVLAVVVAVNHFARQSVTEVQTDHAEKPNAFTVDPAEGVTLLTSGDPELPTVTVAFRPGMVVLDALMAAEQANEQWRFTYSGKGDKALLTTLAGLESEGGDGRNWLYEVSGELAQQSIGVQTVEPGDQVLWKFATYE